MSKKFEHIFSNWNNSKSYTQLLKEIREKAKREKKSVRRKKSSKKHQDKTLQSEKEVINYKEESSLTQRLFTHGIEDDDEKEGYEIYPIG